MNLLRLTAAWCLAMSLSAQPPSTQNALTGGPRVVHELIFIHDLAAGRLAFRPVDARPDAPIHVIETSPIATPMPFHELIPSWNLDAAASDSWRIELRVGRAADDTWSAWFCFDGSTAITDEQPAHQPIWSDDWGRVETDYLLCTRPADRLQVRITTRAADKPDAMPLRIARFAVVVSNTSGDKALRARRRVEKPRRFDRAAFTRRLDVPFMTQHVESAEMQGNICSPTSVAMVMAFRGVRTTPTEIARRAYDPVHKIYGNWPRNVQAAFALGVPGYVTRFSSWEEVEAHVAQGQPIIASIRDPDGRLEGTPYKTTLGHLLVICGFDDQGDVLVNDPAGRTEAEGRRTYRRDQFAQAWFDRGGVAYVLEAKRGE
ncbi:MAG: C39 family peptidase [Phycisphaerae bacterium]|nr:C39 family peptidase [Phycisphaerae bacterium]NUQ46681.1 C39 family peptidase [Phycisphaerae bacterium]